MFSAKCNFMMRPHDYSLTSTYECVLLAYILEPSGGIGSVIYIRVGVWVCVIVTSLCLFT